MAKKLKDFDELVPKDQYSHMATSGVAYGDGWFISLVAYTDSPKNHNKNLVLEYVIGITADSTIDSDLYDPNMTYIKERLVIIKKGTKVSKWFYEGKGFKPLSEKEFAQKKKGLWNSIKNADLPKDKPNSITRPFKRFYWRDRD